jgi:hypothetical protein
MSGCFKIFHPEQAQQREQLFENARAMLAKHCEQLDTPDFYANSIEDVPAMLTQTPQLSFLPEGYWDTGNPMLGWTKGEIPIFLANYCAWKNFLITEHDFLVLCEDDITFHSYGVQLLKHYMSLLPDNWDVFSFYCPTGQYFKYREEEHKFDNGPLSRAYQDHHLLCYVVSRAGAEKLVSDAESHVIMDPIDWFIFYQNDLINIYTVKPREEHGVASVSMDSVVGHRQRQPITDIIYDQSLPVVSHWQRWHQNKDNQ